MHPILASRRLLFYLLAWLPACALLTYLTWAGGGFRLSQAAAVVAPACFVYAFVCLSPWYLCRSRPFSLAALPELAVTFSAAAAAGGLLLAGIAWAVALELKIDATGHLPLWFGVGVLLYLLSTGLHYAGLAAEESRAAEARAAEARTLAREAELQALRLQIHPHFLFNSLHSIAALASVDSARAREMCIRLSDFLRISLGLGSRPTIPSARSWTWPATTSSWSGSASATACASKSRSKPAAKTAPSPRCCCNRWWRTPSNTASPV